MVDLLRAFDFWWIVREILIDRKAEMKRATFIYPFVGLDGESKVENVVWVRKLGAHSAS